MAKHQWTYIGASYAPDGTFAHGNYVCDGCGQEVRVLMASCLSLDTSECPGKKNIESQ